MIDVARLAELRRWVGREEWASDRLEAALVQRFGATLGIDVADTFRGGPAPRLIHLCLCQPAAGQTFLGEDGHPVNGAFLPPVPLSRRMWAGSEVTFTGDLRIGDTVERRSRIASIDIKEGRSGTLCFISVEHHYSNGAGPVARELQSIVYRAVGGSGQSRCEGAPEGEPNETLIATEALLFRYSALTFNAHRIHYDRRYATEVERYPGLVVHGPLQATLLLHLAARMRSDVPPNRFSFRSVSPLYDLEPVHLHADDARDGCLKLWTKHPDGPAAMLAEAHWA